MVRRSVKARLYLQYDICGLIMYDNVLFYRQYITLECLLINKNPQYNQNNNSDNNKDYNY